MQKPRHLFLTGITGSLGSWIAKVALTQGTHITALVRAESMDEAQARTYHALSVVDAASYFKQVHVIPGDVTSSPQPHVEDLDGVLHCAAAMDFAESARPSLEVINIAGTKTIARWTESWSVPLVHMSTAYVAGDRCDIALESEIDIGQGFHNPYEETKCQAELFVRQWAARTRLPLTILRPSIVVGDTQSGRIVNFDGLYTLMRFFDTIAPNLGNKRFRVTACPTATKNVVPVDWVAQAAWTLIKQGRTGTYHLTHPRPITMQQLKDWFVDLFSVPGGQLIKKEAFAQEPPTRLEETFHRAAVTYLPYLNEETFFDRTATEQALGVDAEVPPIDRGFIARLLEAARTARWGKRPVTPLPRSTPPTEVSIYFEEFLHARKNQPLLPDLQRLNATCRIQLEEWPDSSWTLDIQNGILKKVSNQGVSAACTFTLDHPTFSQITAGQLTPHKAFLEQRVDISGNIETGLRLATALGAFFKQWPYDPSEEDAA